MVPKGDNAKVESQRNTHVENSTRVPNSSSSRAETRTKPPLKTVQQSTTQQQQSSRVILWMPGVCQLQKEMYTAQVVDVVALEVVVVCASESVRHLMI